MNLKLVTLALFVFIKTLSYSQSINFDKQLGAENAKSVIGEMGIYNDADKTEYINKVGIRLVNELNDNPFEYQFHIVPEKTPNAFATPGGYIYITTGLFPLLQSEDELACIMAHEIIHAHKRHSVKQMKHSLLPMLLEVPGNLLGMLNENLGAIFNVPIETSNMLFMASYSRRLETEADMEGMKLATAAGYKPLALKDILQRMTTSVELVSGAEEERNYFNDHPYTPERLHKIELASKDLKPVNKQAVSTNFLNELDNVLFGESASNGVFIKNTFLHPYLNFKLTFPEEWVYQNQPTAVAAFHPMQNAGIAMGLEASQKNSEQLAHNFISQLSEKERSKILESRAYTINGENAYMITFQEETREGPIYAYALWMPFNKYMLKFSGIASVEKKEELKEVVYSLDSLSDADHKRIKSKKLKVVEAISGETIADLNKRVGNQLNAQLTAIINDKSVNEILNEHDRIKVVVELPYTAEAEIIHWYKPII
ncbi:MAG: M48 family metalloprotease [Bacteroidales bacterium]|nr:M48 family metalloprotease [Bacteroidales bacterium]